MTDPSTDRLHCVVKKGSFLYSYIPENDPTPPQLTPEQHAKCLGVGNQWPANPPELKEKLLKYQAQVLVLARQLMRTFALGLGAEENYFDHIITAPFASIILQYYPPQMPDAEDPQSLRAHSDFESIIPLYFLCKCIEF